MRITLKYIFPGIFCLANSIALYSQQKTYDLATNETGSSKTYIARDQIVMQPGFQFNASNGNNTFNAKIDPTLVFPPTDNIFAKPDGTITNNPSEGGVVGSIPGQLSVSPSGAATYTIPFECTAGINRMQPSISLVYNSQGGDGSVGVGWSINGLSSISCVPKTLSSNNEVRGLDFSVEGKQYSLDGNVLFASTGSYGGNGTSYYTEIKTYDQIYSYGSVMGQTARVAPEYFKITTKEGKIIEYRQKIRPGGGTYTAPYQWLISKITDANGNYMLFTYATFGRLQTVLRQVTYGGNSGGTSSFATILFNYETKATINTYCIAGQTIEDALLLKSVYIENTPNSQTVNILKKYDLTYNLTNAKYFLSSITQTGENGIKLNPTVFTWGANPISSIIETCNAQAIAGDRFRTVTSQRFSSGDVDGDGFADLLQVYNLQVIGNGVTEYQSWIKASKTGVNGAGGNDVFFNNRLSCTEAYFDDKRYAFNGGVLLGNFNNDQSNAVLVPFFMKMVNCYGIEEAKSGVQIGGTLTVSTEMPAYSIGDINNDGIDELIFIEKKRSGTSFVGKIIYVKKNDYSSELSQNDQYITDALNMTISANVRDIIPSDYNNDGLLDLLLVTENSAIVYKNLGGTMGSDGVIHVTFSPSFSTTEFNSSFRAIQPGDFNGDGLTDFLVNNHKSAVWKLIINSGSGFTSSVMSNITAKDEDFDEDLDDDKDECMIVDLNHDGKSDVITVDAYDSYNDNIFVPAWGEYVNTKVKWYISNGTDFDIVNSYTITDENYFFNRNQTIGDFNGDGIAELFTYDSNLYSGTDNTDAGRIYYFNTNNDANKITNITDGLRNTKQINYQYLTYAIDRFGTKDFYSVGSSSEYPLADLKIPLSCVNRIVQPGGLNNISKDEYSYIGLKAHINKGLIGFTSTLHANSLANRIQIATTSLDENLYLPDYTVSEDKILSTGFTLSKTENWLTNIKSGSVYNSLPFKSVQTDLLMGKTVTTDNFVFDTWGNPTQVRTTSDNMIETKTTLFGQKGTWNWCPNKPISSSIETKLGSQSATRESIYNYDSNGNLISETLYPSDPNVVVMTYSNFDIFGHPKTTQITSNGSTRSSSITYTASGRFVNSKTNTLGETTNFTWDETHGLLSSESNRLGSTAYTYNALGQLIQTKYPDDKIKASVLRWANPGNTNGAKYYAYEELSGSAPKYVWYDALGREIIKETYGLNNTIIHAFTQYQADGKVKKVSEPTFNNTADTWTEYTYDTYGRLERVVSPKDTTSYTYSGLTSTVQTPAGTTIKKLFANGLLEYTEQNGKRVSNTYYPNGLQKSSTPAGGQGLTMEYNLQGKRTKLIDPDAGTIETQYNGFGELISEKQKMHNNIDVITTNNYAPTTGLLLSTVRNGETTNYTYDTKNRIVAVEISGKHKKSFAYDTFDREIQFDETIGSKTFSTKTEYDRLGREKKHFYPSGYYTINYYDVNGYLSEVGDETGRSLYKPLAENARGQLTKVSRGGKETTFGFDDRGLPTSIYSSGVIDYQYSFNSQGNLDYRLDARTDQKELFSYDQLNRLTCWDVFKGLNSAMPIKENNQNYDDNGNISARNGLENFEMKYGSTGRPHALDSIFGKPDAIPYAQLGVTYTDFKKISTLSEGNQFYSLSYGIDDQRRKSVYQINGETKLTRYYLGDYEEEVNAFGNIRKIHYLSAGAVLISNNGCDSLFYGYSDYQGSLIALTNENGALIDSFAYDPWGLKRNPANWTQVDTRTYRLLNRGYTGHEHIDAFGIINMNGRVYDPITGMFFSPDPQLQDPGNWLNYNRYGYCYNNPLLYTDPSGEFLTWSLTHNSFSIGFNLTPIGMPWGAGLNFGWGNGGSLGGYSEIGYRIGGTGLGAGATCSQSLDYSFKNKSWSTTTTQGASASFGPLYAGANVSMTQDLSTYQLSSSWGVFAGGGFGNERGGIGLNVGYSSDGFNWGLGGSISGANKSGLDGVVNYQEPFEPAGQYDYNMENLSERLISAQLQYNNFHDGDFNIYSTPITPSTYLLAKNGLYWDPKNNRYIAGHTLSEGGKIMMHISPHVILESNPTFFRAYTRHEIMHGFQYYYHVTKKRSSMEKVAYAETVRVFQEAGDFISAARTISLARGLGFWGQAPNHYNVGIPFIYSYKNQLWP